MQIADVDKLLCTLETINLVYSYCSVCHANPEADTARVVKKNIKKSFLVACAWQEIKSISPCPFSFLDTIRHARTTEDDVMHTEKHAN